jgi:hypothetical protein
MVLHLKEKDFRTEDIVWDRTTEGLRPGQTSHAVMPPDMLKDLYANAKQFTDLLHA